jgi:tetratricopeptide (TPR) repeat protein
MASDSTNPTGPTSPVEGLPADALADLLAPAPAGISPEELPTTISERYEVRGVLGQGGQGVVLAVRDLRLDREVAAKIARKGLPTAEANLEREAKLAASLEHPSILPTYDLAEAPDGSPILLMRRAPGKSLEDALRACDDPTGIASGALSGLTGRAARLRVFIQLAEAVSFAHARGVLHLDVKPSNVRVGEYGEVFLMDWGLARKLDESSAPLGGTPPYMAPELLEGLKPNEAADVYSLGVVLYRMLSGGKTPYDGNCSNTENYRITLSRSRPVALLERAPDLDADLAAVVDKACLPDRSARYRKVREMVADLEAALDGRPVTARRASLPELTAKWARRHRRALAYAGLLALIAGISAAFMWKEHRNRLERQRRLTATRLRARARIPFDKGLELAMRAPPDHAAAERQFSAALGVDIGYAEAYYARGRSRQALRRYDAALSDLLRATELDSSLIMARYHAGRILMEKRRDEEGARKQFAAMRRFDPDNEYSLLGEGWLATLEGKWRPALVLADRALKSNPDLLEVQNLRGYVFSSTRSPLRSPRKAVAAYGRFLAAMPHNVTALNNRGFALIQLGRTDDAEQDLDHALKLDTDYVPALTNRGWLRLRRGDLAGALRDLDHAQRLNRGYIWIYLNRGEVYERLGNFSRAREDYITAAGLETKNPIPFRRRARLEMRAGQFDKALDFYERALALVPPESAQVVRRRLGLAAYYAGDWKKARTVWRQDVRRRAAGHRLFTGLLFWRLLVELGEEQQATEMLADMAAEKNEKPHLRAAARFCLGTETEAAALAAAADPAELCESYYYMASARLARGELREARELLENCRLMGQLDFTEHLLAGLELRFMDESEAALEKKPPPPPAEKPAPAPAEKPAKTD